MEKGYEGEFYNSHKCFNDVVKFKSRFKATKLASIKRDLRKLNFNMKNNFFTTEILFFNTLSTKRSSFHF